MLRGDTVLARVVRNILIVTLLISPDIVGSQTPSNTTRMERFQHVPGNRISTVVMSNKTRNLLHCCYTCHTEEWCEAVNYNATSGDCDRSDNKFLSLQDPQSDLYRARAESDCFNGSCYWPILESIQHDDAKACLAVPCKRGTYDKVYCERIGGHLADIETADENSFILKFLQQPRFSEYIYFHGTFVLDAVVVLISANDELVEGDFRWSSGLPVSSGYQYWGGGQPQTLTKENCVGFFVQDWKWHDVECKHSYKALCEYPAVN